MVWVVGKEGAFGAGGGIYITKCKRWIIDFLLLILLRIHMVVLGDKLSV